MIATPDERNRLMQEVEGGDMCPTKERKSRWSGTGEMNRKQGELILWGLRPQTPGIFRVDANPSELILLLGLSFH
jgi:hypothetical protein